MFLIVKFFPYSAVMAEKCCYHGVAASNKFLNVNQKHKIG